MSRRLLLTFSTTAWLVGLYLLYARFVSPLVEPAQLTESAPNPQPIVQDIDRQPATTQHREIANTFLPDQNWAKTAHNQYRIGDMYVYAMAVEQIEDQAEIKFRPFALIWKNPKAKPGEPPLRITADSAVLKFESGQFGATFDMESKQAGGRPVWGALEGNVAIDGPHGLKITGRGFTFSEEALKLWSDSDILFQYGPHHATGHGLQVDFLPSSAQNADPDMPKLSGIRSIALLRQVILNLSTEKQLANSNRPAATRKGPEKVCVTSDGRLQYDLESNLVTVEQNVRVAHPLSPNRQETLTCDLLSLIVSSEQSRRLTHPDSDPSGIELASNEADPANDRVDVAAGATPKKADSRFENWLPEHLEIEKLLADGSGKRRVEIDSPQREMHGNTAQIEYDLRNRVVVLRDPAHVDIRQSVNEIHAPEMMLRFAENNRDVLLAVARGEGSANSRLKDGRLFTAAWKKQLIKSNDPRTGLDVIEFQGQASVALDTDYELAGDALRIWISQLNIGNRQTGAADTPQVPQVERIAGVGQVSLRSPQATSHSEWLDVKLQSAQLPAMTSGDSGALFGLDSSEEPETENQRGRTTRASASGKTRSPLDLTAQRLGVLVLRDRVTPTRMALRDLKGEGDVRITQKFSGEHPQPPLELAGQFLSVQNVSPTQQVLVLRGSQPEADMKPIPASIKSGQTRIEGPRIELDREANTLDVNGAGILEYPMKASLEGKPLDRPQVLHVQWQESLKFNGQTADFFEKVEASIDQTTMRCNAMHVTLVQAVNFNPTELQKVKPEQVQLARIFCENRVELVTCEYRQNEVVSRGFGRLGQFVIDNVSGKTEALGPGYFMRWTLGQERKDIRTANNRPSKKPVSKKNASGWMYSRIDFQGHMKGNILDRTATFEDHVEMIYGPVSHATDRIDADNLPEGGAAMTCDSLKVSQFAQTESEPPHLRFSAERNTKLDLLWEGKPLFGMADEVKYDESKDTYLLLSNGDRKVVINKEPTADNLNANIHCTRVEIRPSQNMLKIIQATNIGLQQ